MGIEFELDVYLREQCQYQHAIVCLPYFTATK
jgi:hypothetical protein